MILLEHEAKCIFKEYGIPVPSGEVAYNGREASEISLRYKFPVMIKAQVTVGGRGKVHAIRSADSSQEAESITNKLLSMEIKGKKVQCVLVEEKLPSINELYFGITVDRDNRCYIAMGSSEGGMNIEEVSQEKIIKVRVDPEFGFRQYHAIKIAKGMGYTGDQMLKLSRLFVKFYQMAMDKDAELAEINPLIETSQGEFIAADARLPIDDAAIYRHPEFNEILKKREAELSPQELYAKKCGFSYVKLDGNIGLIGNGAGLNMATQDMVGYYGGKSANFLDLGGGATADRMYDALSIVLPDSQVKAVFVNIMGGITRCDEIAKGILKARKQLKYEKPMVIRLVGTNEEEGRRILTDEGINVIDSMEEGAKMVVEIIQKRNKN
ncbi:MAG: ADP-forming succinate--CoA ligase subunit beta [Candidatus Aenigmarchaeota archaeon]|nr:ADP-forming succinate--CoA ligase subunit beta [Candidatus Aenigmarchaeota archaeon]